MLHPALRGGDASSCCGTSYALTDFFSNSSCSSNRLQSVSGYEMKRITVKEGTHQNRRLIFIADKLGVIRWISLTVFAGSVFLPSFQVPTNLLSPF